MYKICRPSSDHDDLENAVVEDGNDGAGGSGGAGALVEPEVVGNEIGEAFVCAERGDVAIRAPLAHSCPPTVLAAAVVGNMTSSPKGSTRCLCSS